MSRAFPTLAVATLVALVSCQAFTDSGVVQCKTDAECDGRVKSNADFEASVCRESVCVSPLYCGATAVWVPEDPTRRLHTTLKYVDVSLKPVPGAKVLTCSQLDLECKTPLGTEVTTDAEGIVRIEVPFAFRGFVLVRDPPPGFDKTWLKSAVITFPPIVIDEPVGFPVPSYSAVRLLTAAQLDLLLGIVHSKTVAGKAAVFGATQDCLYRPFHGATVEASPIDASVIRFVGDENDIPSVERKETANTGFFGFVNVTPGVLRVESFYKGKKWGSVQAIALPDTITTFVLPPSPL